MADLRQTIADLERQLAECRAERDKALQRETATAEVLQVINSSPGDLVPVFDAMLEKAARLCEAPFGILRTWDGERFHFGAVYGERQFSDWVRREGSFRPVRDSSPLARILEGERVVQLADALGDEGYRTSSGSRRMVDASGIRSAVTVALHKGEALRGTITVYRQEVRPFTDKQIALLQNFAAQAVIAIENARLLTETREALEQQTATAEVLQVINSSPGDLAPVFDAMLEKAMRLCEAEFGLLTNFDGEAFHAAALRGVPASFAESWREPRRPGPGLALHRLTRGENLVHIPDVTAEDAYQSGDPIRRALADLGGARTGLWVALRKEASLLGAFVIYRKEVRPFTEKQIALLQNFAAQAVIAIENARLLTETREALEQQTATAEILQVINSSPGDLAPVFDAILEKAHSLCGADRGALVSFDGEWFRAIATRGMPEAFADHLRRGFPFVSGGPTDELLRGEPVHTLDLAAFAEESPPTIARLVQPALELAGTRTILMVPLCKDGALLGYIAAYRLEVRSFTDKQIALLQNFAAQAVIAMENARLLTETREALEQQTATAEVLGIINSSPGHLVPVFDAILEKAHSLCGVSSGALLVRDGKGFQVVAAHGESGYTDDRILHGSFHPPEGTPLWRVLRGESLIHLADATADDSYRKAPVYAQRIDSGGIRTLLQVPLRKEGELLGVITAFRREVRPFTDKQIALLQNFAAQAVIAMENARLLDELRQRTDQVAELNRGLEARVAEQVEELGRVGRLKRFLAPQLAELIVSQGDEKILESHRREIVVVFCDLRGYTAFTETAEPEEVLDFLREYHGALGPLVAQFEGTLDQFSGDGIMVFFNDPVPCPDPAERAAKMAVAMREAAGALIARWRRRGRELGFGAGIAQGYATLGQIGFAERSGYTAIGTVCNLAARLCAEAKDGQILVAQRVALAIEETTALEEIGALALKGLTQPVVAFNVPAPGGEATA